jgi:hypothetical protein
VSGARRGAVVWVVWIVWLFGVADRKIIVDGDATGAINQARKDPLACVKRHQRPKLLPRHSLELS